MSALTPLEEFQKLQTTWMSKAEELDRTHASATQKPNMAKNRYMDILAMDNTRVVLRELDHDYINANFIGGHNAERVYIGAQAPLPSTMHDFWHMIWQEAVLVVVMLTREIERGFCKADQYWPDSVGDVSDFIPYTITLLDSDEDEEIALRQLQLTNTATQESRIISHIQYKAWPDQGVPTELNGVLDLLQTTNKSLRDAKQREGAYGPMVVHCSAGVGRTGTFIAAHIAAQQICKGVKPDLYSIVDHLREQRRAMVQTRDQYSFIHKLVAEIAQQPEAYALDPATAAESGSVSSPLPSSSPLDSSRPSKRSQLMMYWGCTKDMVGRRSYHNLRERHRELSSIQNKDSEGHKLRDTLIRNCHVLTMLSDKEMVWEISYLEERKGARLSLKMSEVKPFTFREILDWTAKKNGNESLSSRSSVPLYHRAEIPKQKVIHCHDMAGGYQEDNIPEGKQLDTMYNFRYWNWIDIFVYFSHANVAPPPPGWINAAHKHGVQVLGTIMTEWEQGVLDNLLLINAEETEETFPLVPKLVEVALFYGFDGWFVNIESKLETPALALRMSRFLAALTQAMHAALPRSLVIWYDSVIRTGELKWQNRLNENNAIFFDACDGIFTNYWWKEDYPRLSAEHANATTTDSASPTSLAALSSSPRAHDVFIGVDIWGRGTFGGGGYDNSQALSTIRESGCSVALFAPAWTYEHMGKETFYENDRMFWLGMKDRDCSFGVSNAGCISSFIPARLVPAVYPIYCNFHTGFGKFDYVQGKKTGVERWASMSLQSIQADINIIHEASHQPPTVHMFLDDSVGYNSSSSLRFDIQPRLSLAQTSAAETSGLELQFSRFSLLHFSPSSSYPTTLRVKWTWKTETSEQQIALVLVLSDDSAVICSAQNACIPGRVLSGLNVRSVNSADQQATVNDWNESMISALSLNHAVSHILVCVWSVSNKCGNTDHDNDDDTDARRTRQKLSNSCWLGEFTLDVYEQ